MPLITYTPVDEDEIELEQQQQQQQQQVENDVISGDSPPSSATTTTTTSTDSPEWSIGLAFWLLGVFNNASYVIMIASAKTISEGGTAVVFLANILPAMLIKLTAPYWFDWVSYEQRMLVAFGCMVLSFGLVASMSSSSGSHGEAASLSSSSFISTATAVQLLGVALGSAQCGLGEASLLAAAGKCDATGTCISCFSSGTGLAGVFGFLWKFWWNELWECSMSTTLWLAQSLAIAYIGIFWTYLRPHLVRADDEDDDDNFNRHHNQQQTYQGLALTSEEEQPLELTTYHDRIMGTTDDTEREVSMGAENDNRDIQEQPPDQDHLCTKTPVHEMTTWERFQFVAALWPYITPLFVVYATEYSLQAGTWTAIGFPVDDEGARDEFYEFSNWMYQFGVFVSRSSGSLGTAPMGMLWFMPGLQAVNVVLFALVAAHHIWYSYAQLMPLCFLVGLLGGGVYVHGYKRICADFKTADRREFALAATSVAESLGIVCADIMGLVIQACLYQVNGLDNAMVSCPIPVGQR